jgi:cell division protein FtsA
MKDSRIIVGIDIGTSKIAVIIAQVEDNLINIVGVSEVPSRGIRRAQIVDIEDVSGALNNALSAAERMAGYSVDKVFCSISGLSIESQNSRGIVAISRPEGEITQDDIDRVLEAAGAISLPSTKTIIHVIPRSFTVDGEVGIKDPIGMTGVRLEVDTHIITANTTTVRNIEKILETEVGVGLAHLVFSGFASSLSVLTETEKELGAVLVDIGGGVTNICVFCEGALVHSGVIPIGANHITNDLAIGLRVSLESAEKIKLFLSQKHSRKEEITESDEIDLGSLRLAEEIRKVSKKTLIEGIIRPRLNEIFTMVLLELKKHNLVGQTPAGVVVTGGGAKTVGILDSAKRMLSMPTRLGIPTGITGLIDEVEDPSFATAVGLLVFGRQFKNGQSSFLPDFFGGIGSFSLFDTGFLLRMTQTIKKFLHRFLPK